MSDPNLKIGTRAAVVHLIQVAAKAIEEARELPDEDMEFGVAVADHAVAAAAVHAALATEARLGEVVDHLAEIAHLLRPRSAGVGPIGIVHNPNGLTAEQVAEVFNRVTKAQQTGQTPASGR